MIDPIAITLAAFALVFPPVLIVGLGRVGGWKRLAEAYPALGPRPRALTVFGYAVFARWVGYNGGLIVAVDAEALHLALWPVLSWLGHPPIRIPWREFSRIERRPRWFGDVYALASKGAPEVDFTLRPPTFALIREQARAAGVPGDY